MKDVGNGNWLIKWLLGVFTTVIILGGSAWAAYITNKIGTIERDISEIKISVSRLS